MQAPCASIRPGVFAEPLPYPGSLQTPTLMLIMISKKRDEMKECIDRILIS